MVNVSDECLVFYIFWLRTMTESTWKILKLDWKTPFFSAERVVALNKYITLISSLHDVCEVL